MDPAVLLDKIKSWILSDKPRDEIEG
jgi:hypothetical protein